VLIELTSFKSFDSEVPSFYFGSMSPFAHKPFLQSFWSSVRSLATFNVFWKTFVATLRLC